MILVTVFLVFSPIKLKESLFEKELFANLKINTMLVNTFTSVIEVSYPCTNLGDMKLVLGSNYNDKDTKKIHLNSYPCGVNNLINLNENSYIEYLILETQNLNNSIKVKFSTFYGREISSIRLIILVLTILIFIYPTRIDFHKNINSIDLILILPLIIAWYINLKFVIPNWDDGWILAIIRNYEYFGTSNNLWAKYNGIFGNWYFLFLSQFESLHYQQIIFRSLTLIIWIFNFLVVMQILNKFFTNLVHLKNKLIVVCLFFIAILSMGSTLRFEPLISMFLSLSLYFYLELIKFKKIESLNKILFCSAFALTAGLSGLISILFPILSLLYVMKRKEYYKNIFLYYLNFIFFVLILLFFNSNLKLFLDDIRQTRIMTVNSHSFGILDEWRRYFGSEGIFTYYDYPLRILTLIFFVIFGYSIHSLIKNKFSLTYSDFKILILISLVLLSFTPSKWGWYVIPLLTIFLIYLLILININEKFTFILIIAMYVYTFVNVLQSLFWKSNPAINNITINVPKVWKFELNQTLAIFSGLLLISILIFYLFKQHTFVIFSLCCILVIYVFGLIDSKMSFTSNKSSSNSIFAWQNNSLKSCDFFNKMKFIKLLRPLPAEYFNAEGVIEFPQINQEVMLSGLTRYTFTPNFKNINLKINRVPTQISLSFAVRGKNLSKIEFNFFHNNVRTTRTLNSNISDSAIWQLIDPIQIQNEELILTVSNLGNESDFQLSGPIIVVETSLLKSLEDDNLKIFLGPDQIFLGSCVQSPEINNGFFSMPNLVVGNANSGLNIFDGNNVLRVINSCWVDKQYAFIDDCIVQWHTSQ